jgi:dTDP-4-dehydrorhamnose 3,5-epimerase/reductase
MNPESLLVTGANGQLGRALQERFPDAHFTTRSELDLSGDPTRLYSYDWSGIAVVINAAAYTKVDMAETPEGQTLARLVNCEAVGHLARLVITFLTVKS